MCTHISITISGHGGIRKFLPFVSKNIILQLGLDELSAIDIEVLQEHEQNSFKKPKGAAKILLYFSNTAASALVAAGMSTLLDIVVLKSDEKKHNNSKEFVEARPSLERVISLLDQSGLEYRVVGGFAYAAYLQLVGSEYVLSAKRADGTTRDVDIFVLSDKNQQTTELEEAISKELSADGLEVSLHYLGSKKLHHQRTGTHLEDDGSIILRYENILQKLPAEVFEKKQVEYNGISFPTLPLTSLIGQTLSRQGSIPLQDLAKIGLCFDAYPEMKIPAEYFDMARRVREEKPHEYKRWMLKQWVDLFTGNKISTFKQIAKTMTRIIKK